jgi:DNA polymerase-1
LQIHDELLFELSTDIAEEFAQMVHDVMVSVVPLSVPVRAGIETGELWGDLK